MQSQRQFVNIALIGFMGTGKTSVGRLVAEQLHYDYIDTDDVIQTSTGRSITDIFTKDGEPAFRSLEEDVVADLATRTKTVIATGGGLPVNPHNLASLKTHALVVCLWSSPEKIWERVRHQSHGRQTLLRQQQGSPRASSLPVFSLFLTYVSLPSAL